MNEQTDGKCCLLGKAAIADFTDEAQRVADIVPAAFAGRAFAAPVTGVRDHRIAWFEAGHAIAGCGHDGGKFMACDRRGTADPLSGHEIMQVRAAYARSRHLEPDPARLGMRRRVDGLDPQILCRIKPDSLHRSPSRP